MREIKFRGKRVDDGRWAYGHYVYTPITTEFSCDGQFLDSGGKGRPCIIQNNCAHEVDPSTVGQFTGLHDKNGKEIYTGDICKDDTYHLMEIKFGKLPLDKRGDCVCSYEAFYAKDHGKLGESPWNECTEIGEWFEIIGDIYDSPELLTT